MCQDADLRRDQLLWEKKFIKRMALHESQEVWRLAFFLPITGYLLEQWHFGTDAFRRVLNWGRAGGRVLRHRDLVPLGGTTYLTFQNPSVTGEAVGPRIGGEI